jgi:hypothetical protein
MLLIDFFSWTGHESECTSKNSFGTTLVNRWAAPTRASILPFILETSNLGFFLFGLEMSMAHQMEACCL